MKNISNITSKDINKSTPEGQLLWTAICVIGFLKFRDKKPDMILEVLKDIRQNPFVDEPLEKTMERMIEKHKSKNN
jgi:hypothetical protein